MSDTEFSRTGLFVPFGIARLQNSRRRDLLRERFELVRSEIVRTEWTDAVSEACARVKATLERRGEIEDFDAAIAAHAVAAGATLVTTNVRHMARVPGLKIEDWSS